jgi:hypothetical protein
LDTYPDFVHSDRMELDRLSSSGPTAMRTDSLSDAEASVAPTEGAAAMLPSDESEPSGDPDAAQKRRWAGLVATAQEALAALLCPAHRRSDHGAE